MNSETRYDLMEEMEAEALDDRKKVEQKTTYKGYEY